MQWFVVIVVNGTMMAGAVGITVIQSVSYSNTMKVGIILIYTTLILNLKEGFTCPNGKGTLSITFSSVTSANKFLMRCQMDVSFTVKCFEESE